MSFIGNAREGTVETEYVRRIFDGISRVKDHKAGSDLVEVTVRVRRFSNNTYSEDPFIIPADCLEDVYQLAARFRSDLDVLMVDHTPGNSHYNVRAFIKMDETVTIEIVTQDIEPEPVDERRRQGFRSIGS